MISIRFLMVMFVASLSLSASVSAGPFQVPSGPVDPNCDEGCDRAGSAGSGGSSGHSHSGAGGLEQVKFPGGTLIGGVIVHDPEILGDIKVVSPSGRRPTLFGDQRYSRTVDAPPGTDRAKITVIDPAWGRPADAVYVRPHRYPNYVNAVYYPKGQEPKNRPDPYEDLAKAMDEAEFDDQGDFSQADLPDQSEVTTAEAPQGLR